MYVTCISVIATIEQRETRMTPALFHNMEVPWILEAKVSVFMGAENGFKYELLNIILKLPSKSYADLHAGLFSDCM